MPLHSSYTTTNLHLPGYVTDVDPGAVGAGMYWQLESSPFTLKKRNASNSGWDTVSAGASAGTVTSVAITVPTGFAVSGTPITTNGTFAITGQSPYLSQAKWGVD